MTITHQVPMPMEFSRQEYWSGLPFPSPVSQEGIQNTKLTKVKVVDLGCNMTLLTYNQKIKKKLWHN